MCYVKNMKQNMKTFKTFLTDVNLAVEAKLGLGIHDLPDFAFCDYWDADIADHPIDYQNMVDACVEDFLYDQGVTFGVGDEELELISNL